MYSNVTKSKFRNHRDFPFRKIEKKVESKEIEKKFAGPIEKKPL